MKTDKDKIAPKDQSPRGLTHKDRRERIATAALQGLISCRPPNTIRAARLVAVEAVEHADALMRELQNEPEQGE